MDVLSPNLLALNTSGMSSYVDPTGQLPGPTSSTLITPDAHRLGSWVSSTGDVQRASTSDVMSAAQHALDPDQDND